MIPKIFHRVWVGPHKIPDEHEIYWESWQRDYPDYEFKTWTNKELDWMINLETFLGCKHFSEQSDIARYEILYKFGGIYVDTDFESLKPFDFSPFNNFACQLEYFRLAVGLIGVVPDNNLYKVLVNNIKANYKPTGDSYSLGPLFYTAIVQAWQKKVRLNDLTIFERKLFYPYHYEEKKRIEDSSFAVHHWFASYRKEEFQKTES